MNPWIFGCASTFRVVSMRRRLGPDSSMNADNRIAVSPPEVIPFSSSWPAQLKYSEGIWPLWKPAPIQNETPMIVAFR